MIFFFYLPRQNKSLLARIFNICEPLVKSNQDALAIALQSPDLVEAGFMHAGTIKSRTNKKSRFYLMLFAAHYVNCNL